MATVSDRALVYNYLDYRAFLRDYYNTQKKRGRGFSFRAFSKRAGLRSPNYLKLVMDGERNITEDMAKRFARACQLDGAEAEYFTNLVAFTQATTAVDRDAYYQKLTGTLRYRSAHRLDLAHKKFHTTWYLPAIHELVSRRDFREDPAWIARTLVPSITKREAERAIHTLLNLGLLRRNAEGRLVQGELLVTTGPEATSHHIASYHRMMMERAAASIDYIERDLRDISSLTLCLSEEGLKRYKERIQAFRRELLDLSLLEKDPSRVVQINFQLFPLSNAKEPSR